MLSTTTILKHAHPVDDTLLGKIGLDISHWNPIRKRRRFSVFAYRPCVTIFTTYARQNFGSQD